MLILRCTTLDLEMEASRDPAWEITKRRTQAFAKVQVLLQNRGLEVHMGKWRTDTPDYLKT